MYVCIYKYLDMRNMAQLIPDTKEFWQTVMSEGILTDEFIMKNDRYADWNFLSEHYNFTQDMLRKYQHKVNWCHILRRWKFSEEFLREMATNFSECWSVVSMQQTLSLKFIHDYANKVDWELIILYQNVPEDFLTKHIDYMQSTEYELLAELSGDDNEYLMSNEDSDTFDYPSSIGSDYYKTDTEYESDYLSDSLKD